MNESSHETLHRDENLKPGSDRGFGVVMAVAFLVLAGLKAWVGSWSWAAVWLGIAACTGRTGFGSGSAFCSIAS